MDLNEPSVSAGEGSLGQHSTDRAFGDQALSDQGLSDQDLIERLYAGQLGALQAIYRRYSRLVYTLAHRVLHSSEEAEEITQDVFVTLWEKGGYRPERGGLSGYLSMMARSKSIDRVRSRSAHHQRLQKWHVMAQAIAQATPLEFASLTERSQGVRQALTILSEKERHILEIAYYDGLSQSEIAERLGLPLGTVKTCSRRALQKLRHALRDVL